MKVQNKDVVVVINIIPDPNAKDPRQLRFPLYSGAVITRTWFSL